MKTKKSVVDVLVNAKDTTYNGWTNYETWVTKLWMDNDQWSQDYWRDETKDACAHPVRNKYMNEDRWIVAALVARLRAYHEEQAEVWIANQASVFADLMNAGLSRVNWHEIAEALITDNQKE